MVNQLLKLKLLNLSQILRPLNLPLQILTINLLVVVISAFSIPSQTQPWGTNLKVLKVDTSNEGQTLERKMWRPLGQLPEQLKGAPTIREGVMVAEATRTTREGAAAITEGATIKGPIIMRATTEVADSIEAGTAAVDTKREPVDRMAAEVAVVGISSLTKVMKREAISNGEEITAVAKTSIEAATAMRKVVTLIAGVAEVAEEGSSISTIKDHLELHLLAAKGVTEVATREVVSTTPNNSGSTPSPREESRQISMGNIKRSEASEFSYFL